MTQPTHQGMRVFGVFCIAALGTLIGCQRDAPLSDPTPDASKKVWLALPGEPAVELVIDYGDGVERRFTRIPFEDGMTVLGALRSAAEHPRGITFEKTGSGEAAMLTKIDDLANQTTSGDKNWIYRVNGKLATKSFDAYVLSPGDVILWRLEAYE